MFQCCFLVAVPHLVHRNSPLAFCESDSIESMCFLWSQEQLLGARLPLQEAVLVLVEEFVPVEVPCVDVSAE